LLKLRNAAGDRCRHAADFFRVQGIEDDVERDLPVIWITESAALAAP
jgi:hypothetical protein